MTTFAGTLLNWIFFLVIWFFASWIVHLFGFLGFDVSGASFMASIGEYLRKGIMWYVCPAIGAYCAPSVTERILPSVNTYKMLIMFKRTLVGLFVLFVAFSVFIFGMTSSINVPRSIGIIVQFLTVLVGTHAAMLERNVSVETSR